MHFYDFNIGDYAKKTGHLTNGEDLAYRRALDVYYDTEKPFDISGGLATLSRRLRVDEKDLKNVIDEFFPDGRNKHADEKIAQYYAFLKRQSDNGKRGGRPKHKAENPVVSGGIPSATPVPNQPLPTNHYPLTTTQEKTIIASDAGRPLCPHEKIIEAYHRILPELPSIRRMDAARKSTLQARWRESEKHRTIEFWEKYFTWVRNFPFYLGENDRKWKADFSWLINSKNFTKILEKELS